MNTFEEIAHYVVKGMARGVTRFIGGVVSIAIVLAVVMTAGEYHAKERIEAERDSKPEISRASTYSVPPSRYDGWGDESLESGR